MNQKFTEKGKECVGLYLSECGYEGSASPFSESEKTHEGYGIYYVSQGAGELTADKANFFVTKGELFLLRPEVKFSCRPESDRPWEISYMIFDGADAEFYLKEAGLSHETVVKKASGRTFVSSVASLADAQARGEAPSSARLVSVLLDALNSIGAQSGRKRLSPASQVKKALSFIDHNYMRGITSRDVSVQLGIDRTYFFRIFKASMGISPEKYIVKCRIDKAADMLASDGYTVTEIASAVGVRDVYYFSKLFKKSTGMSPTEYRNNLKGQADA